MTSSDEELDDGDGIGVGSFGGGGVGVLGFTTGGRGATFFFFLQQQHQIKSASKASASNPKIAPTIPQTIAHLTQHLYSQLSLSYLHSSV